MTPQKLAAHEPNYLRILEFETAHPHRGPNKNARIRHELHITEIRYYTLLHRAAQSVEGIEADPVVARMVRQRAERQAAERASRTSRGA